MEIKVNDRDKLYLISSIVGFVAFFLPWVGGGFIGQLSGYDLLNYGQQIGADKSWFLILLPASFFIISLSKLGIIKSINPSLVKIIEIIPIALILFSFAKLMDSLGIKLEDFGEMDSDFLQIFKIGFYLTLLASIIAVFTPVPKAVQPQPSTQNVVDPQPQEQQYTQPIQQEQQTHSPSPSINEQLEPVLKNIGEFLYKNKKILLGAVGILVIGITVYKLFLKPDPIADGKKAASFICDCQEKYTANNIAAYTKFLSDFSSYNFKTRSAALSKLEEAKGAETQKLNQCLSESQIKSNELRSKYLSDGTELQKFDFTRNEVICIIPDETKKQELYAQIDSKIKEIKDAQPDIDKIKSDLLGKRLGNANWNFAYLSEFKNITIKNKSETNSNLEYTLDMDLVDYRTQEPYHAVAIISYALDNWSGWQFQNIVATEYGKVGQPITTFDFSNTNSTSQGKYPQASQRLLSASELNGMSKQDLKIMRNEIFARHGYIFKTPEMKSYFANQSWYSGQYDDVTSMLSTIEKQNVELIKKYE